MSDISLKEQIKAILDGGKSMGLCHLAGTLKISDLEAAQNLPDGSCKIIDGARFPEVWKLLVSLGKLTFIVNVGGNMFEIACQVPEGKEGFGFFNLFGEGFLNGHLRPESVKNIAFVSIPFMKLESHQIAFMDEKGQVLYSFYLGREQHRLIDSQVEVFKTFTAWL